MWKKLLFVPHTHNFMQMLTIYFMNVILKTGRNHSVAGHLREIQYLKCEVSIFSWRTNSNILVAYNFIPLCTQSLKTSQHMSNFFNHTNEDYRNTVKTQFFTSAGTIPRGSDIEESGKSKTLKSSILKTCGWHITKDFNKASEIRTTEHSYSIEVKQGTYMDDFKFSV